MLELKITLEHKVDNMRDSGVSPAHPAFLAHSDIYPLLLLREVKWLKQMLR